MNKMFAPIIVFGYNRPDALNKCINSLALNPEAIESDLFIFCDGCKGGVEATEIKAVREIATREAECNRFAKVYTELSEQNKGLAESVIGGVTKVINQYGKCIVVEDDLVVDKQFLKFMNGALNYYEEDNSIWGITGYTYPFKSLDNYSHDCYLSYRICSWGWATWRNRWKTVDWEVKDYKELFYKPWRWIRFNRGGNDLFRMLRRQMQGKRDSWAIRFCYAQSRQEKMAVHPRKTLLINEGFDGKGTHCEEDPRFVNLKIENTSTDFCFEKLQKDKAVLREYKSLFKVTVPEAIESIKGKIRRLLIR